MPNLLYGFQAVLGVTLTGPTGCAYTLIEFRTQWASASASYTNQWIYASTNPKASPTTTLLRTRALKPAAIYTA